ncbi:haloacid dehalogenase-like hydrolase [Streptomyces sp. NPDC020681]|uniref:haloacid dehalogenase-like hydrolase n=1 Tax=Streptomyces sp. NPDC020681 TaxID=3365083 RepID=UPI0037BE0483
MKVAVMDVDGTLLPGSLAGPLPRRLRDAGLVPADRYARLHSAVAGGDPEDPAGRLDATRLFGELLTDVPRRIVEEVAAEVWQERRKDLFGFVLPLIAALKSNGFVTMLISGGPQAAVAHLAADLAVDHFRGSRFEEEEGLYTGRVASVDIDAKDRAAEELAGAPITWSQSIAIGNSLGDVQLFHRARHGICFEASPRLRALAHDHSWPLADRHSILGVLRNHTTGPVIAPDVPRSSRPPRGLSMATRRLTGHLLSHVGPDGAIRCVPESRVTESALLLTLLRRERAHPSAQHALRGYLESRAPLADAFDTAVINATLHGVSVPQPDRLIEQVFKGIAQHSSARKRLALSAILTVVGPKTFHVDAPSYAFNHRGEATWTQLRMVAIHHLNTPEPVAPELTSRLLRMTEHACRHGIYEQQTFSHLFAFLAISRVLPGHSLVREGVGPFLDAMNPDGGLPFIVREEVFTTATAGLALARARAPRSILTEMADYVATLQSLEGGWANAEHVEQTDVDTTTQVLAFLQAVEPNRYRDQIAGARRYLCSYMRPDGGVPTFLPGQPGEPTMTANTAAALIPYIRAHRDQFDRAIGYLLDAQHPDGTFERSWSLSESNAMFRALHTLRLARRRSSAAHQGRLTPAIDAIHTRLLTTANPDGGWGQTPGEDSDPMSTAYSLSALAAEHRDSAVVHNGVRYLLTKQQPDGGYASVSDQAAPRPLRYSVPVLPDIFVLLALAHLGPPVRYST